MERYQKLRESMIADELAVTRAAAWAWYQRGSGTEPKPTSEFGLTRTHRVPNPTRYKLEAERSVSASDGSHLLDRYEIESISKHLEKYIERGDHDDLGSHRRAVFSPGSDVSGVIKKEDEKIEVRTSWNRQLSYRKKEENIKKSKGFWLMRHGVACGGSRDDVVDFGRRVLRERPPRRPGKGGGGVVGAAGAAISRPQTTHIN